MSRQLVLISGPISSGKSKLAQLLSERFGAQVFKTRVIIAERARLSDPGRLELQAAGDALDVSTDHKWVMESLSEFLIDKAEDALVVVDSLRTTRQIDHIRHAFGTRITHLHSEINHGCDLK